ncbi:hypothetical protein [Amphritea sp.]|uniref:hypothetical protein n=1 Tax=Amphritea sp. TaxID=1872502 RepID=UPI003A93AFD3
MTPYNYNADTINLDLNVVVAQANEARAAYLKEILSNAAKKVVNLFSAELPAFISGPLAHR